MFFMKKISLKKMAISISLCIVFLFGAALSCYCQIATSLKEIEGGVVEKIKTDSNNNIYFSGGTSGSSSLRYDNSTFQIPFNSLFIGKTDSLGNLIWINIYETSDFSRLTEIAIDSLGFIYVSGFFHGHLVIDSTRVFNSLSNSMDGILIKLTSQGNIVWVKPSFSSGSSRFWSPLIISNNLYIINSYGPTIAIDTLNLIGDPIYGSCVILKMDTAGNITSYLNGINASVHELESGPSKNLYFIGTYYRPFTLDAIHFQLQGQNNTNTFLMKLDSTLSIINYRTVAYSLVPNLGYQLNGLAISSSEEIYLGGFLVTPQCVVGDDTLFASSSLGDVFVSVLDSGMNTMWSKTFGGTSYDVFHDIEIDQYDRVYLLAEFNDSTIYDGLSYVSDRATTSIISRIDHFGNVIWSKFNEQGRYSSICLEPLSTDKLLLLGSNLPGDTLRWGSFVSTLGDTYIVQFSESIITYNKNPIGAIEFSIYPNPAITAFTLKFRSIEHNERNIRVINSLGQTVFSTHNTSSQITIPVNNWQEGIYHCIILDNDKKYDSKLIIVSGK